MKWPPPLLPGESLRWQGRPAPRCWTFRNWRHSLFGMILLPFCFWWQMVGLSLSREYASLWTALLPAPVLLAALYLAFGHLLLARLEWEEVCFAITDRRILTQRGLRGGMRRELFLDQVGSFQLLSHGENLGTVRIHDQGGERRLTLSCCEYPQQAIALLEAALAESGAGRQGSGDRVEIV